MEYVLSQIFLYILFLLFLHMFDLKLLFGWLVFERVLLCGLGWCPIHNNLASAASAAITDRHASLCLAGL